MRPLGIAIVVGSVFLACSIRTEFAGIPGNTTDEAGTDGGPLLPAVGASGADASASATGDAAADASSATPEAGTATNAADATSCLVLASDYDQTCAVDMDCVNVGEVLMCPADECSFCPMETINARAAAQYMAAFSVATAAIPADATMCGCPEEGRPCCVAGKCQQCFYTPLRP